MKNTSSPKPLPIADRCRRVDALWALVLEARRAMDANPTEENRARHAQAWQAWKDAE